MAETTLTLSLEGQVWLTDFTSVMTHFQELVEALCEHLNREAVVHWEIVDLKAGSTVTTIRGASLDHEFLAQVSNAFPGYNGFCGSCSTPFMEPETSKFSSQLSA
jgi:hypothetical protein